MALTGHVAGGITEIVWGAAVVVGISDYVIRPRLVGDEAIPTLITFIALFGGVEVLGLKGLVTGPVVMSVAIAILRIYVREARAAARRRAPPEPAQLFPPLKTGFERRPSHRVATAAWYVWSSDVAVR